ncbi:hypothetical protein MHC_00850 [Mycoplasma haemocanis str. Illinois]|uniref:Uncharacterized protein n=1 Tax=Mycoplasma haemocanis (strain Illinois) TaxID=1111676 RepID=H6N5S6_MYCHN|nr:hypothetical protein [Mycoplasma haemocanis]AEW45036.1 hypothetical protein MHC_00850 [Mycoplasma haemocanis str. Illinois]
MNGLTKVGILLTSTTGVTGIGISGVYYVSLETIGSLIKDDVLGEGEDFKESWKSQHKKLLEASKENLSPKLASIKEKYTDNNNVEGHKALTNWCKDTYSQTYKNAFSSENRRLLSEAQKYCIQSIKERTESGKIPNLTDSTDSSTFTNNYKKLNNHNESTSGKLDDKLLSLKKSYKSNPQEAEWKAIQSWCFEALKKAFKGSKNNLFLLTQTFCKKA